MALTYTPDCHFDWVAPGFNLTDAQGRTYQRADCAGPQGLLVMFICNHCPYVQAILSELVADCRALMQAGMGCVAIMPNDFSRYPEDDPAHMQQLAQRYDFPFPYLVDSTQAVAKAYDAVCTPDFFGFNKDLKLQYRGRFAASQGDKPVGDAQRELLIAMQQICETGLGPARQNPSMGCSIKWKS